MALFCFFGFASAAAGRYNVGVAQPTSPQGSDTDQISRRLITIGCVLLVFPCVFLVLALLFYLSPVFTYALRNGFGL